MTEEKLSAWRFSLSEEAIENLRVAILSGKDVQERLSSFKDGEDYCQIIVDGKVVAHVNGY